MEAATKLNSMQLFMLKIFERPISNQQEEDIKQLLVDYFAKQIDLEMDRIWDEKAMTQEDLDKALVTHKRTKYQ
ncbi:hypothetical protein [Arcicella rigui]|uniref:Uncharacterized protein n=1 Tax=Arcicella rigui TaxID=797020 RepID=A0ABU5QBM1_9BACT|nr:hypothetical protein [Arcicella rigui]MEA5140253.1 hypothetical protein [Arcicella rigui]